MSEYTFVYCQYHDDGCIIKGNHDYVPDGYKMAHSNKCESCDWYVAGVIRYDSLIINILKTVRINFDCYGGCYTFRMYTGEITDQQGNSIMHDKYLPLLNWIEDVQDYADKTNEVFIS